MKQLVINNLGPIKSANINFGDLTILVGPQASGKSIFIQMLKLLIDKNQIRKSLEQYGYVWGRDASSILDLYLGEGMSGVWNSKTEIHLDSKNYSKDFLIPKKGRYDNKGADIESLFYIPAQRILSVADGRPKTFMEFDSNTPYVLRHFSEVLRQLMQNGMTRQESIFPISNRLKEILRKSFNDSIFHNGKVVIDHSSNQKKMRMSVDGMSVPFITWSAGQKEFMPLLLGFYWLCPPGKVSRKDSVDFVVIEEPEMGLHPQAIQSVILQILDLMSRGYKVIISTHSPVLLEFAWAFRNLQSCKADTKALFDLFGLSKSAMVGIIFKDLLKKKQINTFYFERKNEGVSTKDISTLDAGDEDTGISEWGGISSFITRATDIIANNIG